MAKKNSLKNCKPLVELVDTATPGALATLSRVDCFGFLGAIERDRTDPEIRSALKATITGLRRDVVAVANQEAVRLLQLMSFRTEMLLQHAFEALSARADVDLSSYDSNADAMTRLIWLRSSAQRMFDEIETIFLTHHFHGHRKLHGFAIPDGDGRSAIGRDVAHQAHARRYALAAPVLSVGLGHRAEHHVLLVQATACRQRRVVRRRLPVWKSSSRSGRRLLGRWAGTGRGWGGAGRGAGDEGSWGEMKPPQRPIHW